MNIDRTFLHYKSFKSQSMKNHQLNTGNTMKIKYQRGAHFKDNEGFEAYWAKCEALLKSRVPPSYPATLRMCVGTASPPPRQTTEIRSIELIQKLPMSHKMIK